MVGSTGSAGGLYQACPHSQCTPAWLTLISVKETKSSSWEPLTAGVFMGRKAAPTVSQDAVGQLEPRTILPTHEEMANRSSDLCSKEGFLQTAPQEGASGYLQQDCGGRRAVSAF